MNTFLQFLFHSVSSNFVDSIFLFQVVWSSLVEYCSSLISSVSLGLDEVVVLIKKSLKMTDFSGCFITAIFLQFVYFLVSSFLFRHFCLDSLIQVDWIRYLHIALSWYLYAHRADFFFVSFISLRNIIWRYKGFLHNKLYIFVVVYIFVILRYCTIG